MKKYIPNALLCLLPFIVLGIANRITDILYGEHIFNDRNFILIVVSFNVLSLIVAIKQSKNE